MKKKTIGIIGAIAILLAADCFADLIIMDDGFETADTLAGNGWSGSWSFSASTYGNPDNYAYYGSDASATIEKDTAYVIQAGDQFNLTFDYKDLDSDATFSSEVLTATLYFNDGSSDVVLGSETFAREDYVKGWTSDLTLDTITSTGASVGENLRVRFTYENGAANARVGIDNVAITATVIPEPATIGMLGLGTIITFLIRRQTRS
jgi:hypothetical protein